MKHILRLIFLVSILVTGTQIRTFAQDDSLTPPPVMGPVDSMDFYDMTLEQLLTLKAHGVPSELEALINSLISVASKKALSTRESPSIISLITEEEIKNSGARDLMDVLNLVPGFDFGVDVTGVTGIGNRGNWAHEGKILLLLDGQEMNEIMFSTLQFGNHFSPDQIKKIEIIRGPGSAIYGGFAEYGVINIITKNGEELNGLEGGITVGQMKDYYGRRNVNLAAGKKFGDLDISLSAFAGKANRSDKDYVDYDNDTISLAGNSKLDPGNLNLGVAYKGFSFRGIADHYITNQQDNYGVNTTRNYPNNFFSYYGELKYIWKISEKITLTPKFNYLRQKPWNYKDSATSEFLIYNKTAERYRSGLNLFYKYSRRLSIILGGEHYKDVSKDLDPDGGFSSGESKVSYDNFAVFTEGLFKHRIVNLIVGARFDQHNIYGNAFNPRLGLTRKWNKFHFKALYSHAFRAPGIENINFGLDIKPEKTRVTELETGYKLSKKMILTVNLFDITTLDPILYYGISDTEQVYQNFPKTGTQGFEIEYKFKEKWGYINLNYSFYTARYKDRPEAYDVPGHSSYLLGFPKNKINLNSCFDLTKQLKLNATILLRGTRYGFEELMDDSVTQELRIFKPNVYLNLFIRYEDLFVKGLSAGIGVYNILDQPYFFIQPYNGGHRALPGPSREFVFRVAYDLNFNGKGKKG